MVAPPQGLDAPLKIDAKKELMATFLSMDEENLLNRRKLVGNSAYDLLCPHLAAALAANGTPAERRMLQSGKESKHRAIRDACGRAG